MTSHVNSVLNIAGDVINRSDCPGNTTLSTVTNAAPELDTTSVRSGAPCWLIASNALDAYPPHARLNDMHVDAYSCILIDDSTAVSTTKFITSAPPTIPRVSIIRTKGFLLVSARYQGATTNISANVQG